MLNLPNEKEGSLGERRGRNEVELPKIARAQTAELGPIALRFHWLVQPREYSRDSLAEIQEEYNKLRKELIGLNEQAAKNVEKLAAKTSKKLPKSTDLSRVAELSSKQGENNLAIITRLRVQLERLEQRLISVSSTSKDQLDDGIAETKQQIIALRHRNKQLKQKSKQIGDNIETSDDIFGEIKRLEMELSVAERKKSKLSGKWKEVCSNLDKLKKGITDMKGEATSAENFIEEQLEQSQAEKQEKKLESTYHQRVLGVDIIKKNMQSFNTLKQLKYHQTLKQLEDITAKLTIAENTINLSEQKQMRQRNQLVQLEQELKLAVEKAKLRALEPISHSLTQEEEKQNEDDQVRNDKIVKIHRKKVNTKQQLRKSLNARIEPKEVKGKPTELRLNKSINLKQQKQLNTIDSCAFTEKAEQMKAIGKNSTSMKLNRMNRSYQQRQKQKNTISNSIGPQTMERKAFGKRESMKNTLYEQKNERLQQIQQDICASYLNEQPLPSSQQPNKQQITLFISESPSSAPKHIEANKEDSQQSEEQSDEDIKEFKKSITEQMTNPSAGLRSVDIALGEIETTIRQHQKRSRMNRYQQEKPIDEEQESFH